MNPRRNVIRKRRANKRMRQRPDHTITVGYDSLTNHRFREAIGGIPFKWN